MSNTSFDKIIDKVFDGFKKVTPALVALALISGFVLFLPTAILEKLGLNNLPPIMLSITGIVFLLSSALIITILGSVVFKKGIKKIKHKQLIKGLKKKCLELSPPQKKIIISLLKSSSKSIELDGISGDTIYLSENHFIYRPQQVLTSLDNQYVYVPHPWLIDLFQKEPELFILKNEQNDNGGHHDQL